MFESFALLFPADWQGAVLTLLAPMRWLAAWQSAVASTWIGGNSAGHALAWVTLLLPALLLAAGMWCTVASIYTLPFRSGRGAFITSMLMAWWDAGRCIWLFWTGMLRVGVALVGWVIGSVRFAFLMVKNILLGILRSPFTLLNWSSQRYFQPGVPWVAFLVLTVWCAIEATVFTFTLQPTLNEVFGSLTGFDPNPRVMAPLLWMFLFMLVAGSFACVQVVTEAIKEKKVGTIVQMLVVESAVMFFEVIFLYRELIDAITPWIAQQSGGSVHLGIGATLALASFGWLGVRGMSWFLFGRFGTPALLAVLSRQAVSARRCSAAHRAARSSRDSGASRSMPSRRRPRGSTRKRSACSSCFRSPCSSSSRPRSTSRSSRSSHDQCSHCRSSRSRKFSLRRRWRMPARRWTPARESSRRTIPERG